MLVNAVEFELPEAIVEEEVVQLANAKLQGLSADERKEVTSSEEKTNALKEEQREEAKARVKTTLVVDHLAKKESISITDQEVQQTIYYEAYTQQQDPKTVYEYYQKEGFLPVIKMSMLEDRILSHLLNTKLKQEA
jgi:trigger factor